MYAAVVKNLHQADEHKDKANGYSNSNTPLESTVTRQQARERDHYQSDLNVTDSKLYKHFSSR